MEPLDLSQLLHLVEEMPAYRQLLDELRESRGNTKVAVLDAVKPYLIAALYQSLHRPMMVITAQPESCKRLYEQILTWCRSDDCAEGATIQQTTFQPTLGNSVLRCHAVSRPKSEVATHS